MSKDVYYRRAEFEKHFRTSEDFSQVHGFTRETVRPGYYSAARAQTAWEHWRAAIDVANAADAETQPVAKRTDIDDIVAARLIDAFALLVRSYVKDDGGIAMVAANGGADPAIREAWLVVQSWLGTSNGHEVIADLAAIKALRELNPSITNVTNLMPGKLKKFKNPKKAIVRAVRAAVADAVAMNVISLEENARAVRKAVRKELQRFEGEVTVNFDPESLGMVKLEELGYEPRDGREFNGSNGDPSVVITFPSVHDGAGNGTVVRFTGVVENEHSGERWLVNAKVDGMATTPFVQEADVSRIPD